MMGAGSLFTGYGGLDGAVEQVFGARAVWTSDIDPGACKIIAHRMPHAPNLGDITAIDWARVEPVDIITAGWPCQPFSHAGKRLGAADERALWPEVARAVRALRPRHVLLENVAAIASAGELARAVGDLSAFGYDAQWTCLRAADVGAPHGRARIFILGTDTHAPELGRWAARWDDRLRTARLVPILAADTECGGWDGRAGQLGPGRRAEPADSSGAAADTESGGRQDHPYGCDPNGHEVGTLLRSGDRGSSGHSPQGVHLLERTAAELAWGAYEPAIRRWERVLGRPAPAPTETSPRGTQRLSPKFVEWLMGVPEGWVTDVPGLGRNAQLKALGNGVVPQQAAAALRLMLDQLSAVA